MPNIVPYLVMTVFIAYIACFFMTYFGRSTRLPSPEYLEMPVKLGFPNRLYRMSRMDILPLAVIMVIYAGVAFGGLGDRVVPENRHIFEDSSEYAEMEFSQPQSISKIMYYSGIFTEVYHAEVSVDGSTWTQLGDMEQKYGDVLRWNIFEPEYAEQIRFLRIKAGGKLDLAEVAVYNEEGMLIPADSIKISQDFEELFDEQKKIPEDYSYLNSTYFDEIYHARTAYEHILGVWPYEISHPPLGKIIMSLGIKAFGLNPFGWRFMGTLFGVLMLPALYVLLKNMFGKTKIAVLGTTMLAADFMHFTQTRISTIDTYAVFFILLMYLFMYRFVAANHDDPFLSKWRMRLNLFLSGLCFGLGAASKWVVIYGVLGLALMWLLHWIFRGRDMIAVGHKGEFVRSLLTNIAWCILFFIIVPCAVYYVSYYPYGIGKGLEGGIGMYFKREYFDVVISNQKFMFTYHRDVKSEHPYASTWYMWLVNARPILYFLDGNDPKSAFGAFLNPMICWGGFIAMVSMGVRVIRDKDKRALFIVIGYLSQLLPWVFISRETFAYHYFPSLIFLLLALCYIFSDLDWRLPTQRNWSYSFAAVMVLLFIAFYPVLSGVYVPRFYTDNFIKWLPSWPF